MVNAAIEKKNVAPCMICFDTAYTYDILTRRGIEALVVGRDLKGYFDHVWTVHAVASLLFPADSSERFGRPIVHKLGHRHTFVEGKIGRFSWLRWLPVLNFIIAQLDLLIYCRRLIRFANIKIVRAEDCHYSGFIAWVIGRLSHVPVIMGVWGNPGAVRSQTKRPLSRRLFKWVWLEELIEGWIVRRADCVLVQNEDNRRFVISCGVPPARTEVFRFGNVISSCHFVEPQCRDDGAPDLRAVGAEGMPVILCISRLEALKLTDHVIRVVKVLRDTGQRVKAVFAGYGSQEVDLVELARQLGVSEDVIICGDKSQEWLARVIPKVTVVVAPLKGRALAEAALGGAPIVAYDIDWHSELIESGLTGELVPYLNYEAMAIAVKRIIDQPSYAHKMGVKVRERAMLMLDPTSADQLQMRTYERLYNANR